MNDLKRNATSSMRKVMVSGQSRLVVRAAVIAAMFCAVGLFHTASRIAGVRAGYDLGKVERANRELLREQERLKLERATLRSAPRLETIARSKLGMAPPSATQLVVVKPSSGHERPAADRTFAAAGLPRAAKNP